MISQGVYSQLHASLTFLKDNKSINGNLEAITLSDNKNEVLEYFESCIDTIRILGLLNIVDDLENIKADIISDMNM